MLLPLRWLLYAITGPTEEERGQFGGKKRKLPLRKTPRRVTEWSDALAPAFEPATVIQTFGVTARPRLGAISDISIGLRVTGAYGNPMVGNVQIWTNVGSVKACPRIGRISVKADIALFEHEIAALMLS